MKKFKNIVSATVLSLSLAASLTACGAKEQVNETTAAEETEAASVEETKAETETEAGTEAENEDAKVKVGVSWALDEPDEDIQMYLTAVEKAGGEAVYLPQIKTEEDAKKALAEVDALVMTGGEDIDPSYYDQEPHEKLETLNEARDISDVTLLKTALDEDIPILCTCRGMQLLNVVSGGTLYQDIPTQHPSEIEHRDPERVDFAIHDITVDDDNLIADAFGEGGTYTVNSWHHQGVDELGDNLKVVATAADDIVEGIVREDKTYVVGVQFHPEWMIEEGDEYALGFYTDLIEQAEKAE